MANTLPFHLISAFTNDPYSGNLAAVVFIDLNTPFDCLARISANFNQPMTVFISAERVPSDDPASHVRNARFVTASGKDSAVCGHGSIAAARLMFGKMGIAEDVIEFRAHMGAVLTARKLPDDFIELALPSNIPQDLPAEEQARLTPFFNKAFGRELAIRTMKYGGHVYPQYLFIELDEDEDLAGSVVDPDALKDNGFSTNVVTTTAAKHPEADFLSRMFSPLMIPGGEDHVCGSMHGLLAPYWEQKYGLSPGTVMRSKQVSPRGGALRVQWDAEAGIVKLQGQCAMFAFGTLVV